MGKIGSNNLSSENLSSIIQQIGNIAIHPNIEDKKKLELITSLYRQHMRELEWRAKITYPVPDKSVFLEDGLDRLIEESDCRY